jgi:hypothetical protein
LSIGGSAATATSATTATTATSATTAGTVTTAAQPNITSVGTLTGLTVSGNAQISSLGVGTAASGTSGEIRATNNITAYYSDQRLKTVESTIPNALDKVMSLSGVYYTNNDVAKSFGYDSTARQVGVLAQQVEEVLPEIVTAAPFDIGTDENGNEISKSGENYKTVYYDKLVPLLIEAVKELSIKVNTLSTEINMLKGNN